MILLGFLLFVVAAGADERADRTAIDGVVDALNAGRVAGLFSEGAQNDLRRLSESTEPLSEVTKPRILVQSILFPMSDVALVDAMSVQYGSTIMVRRVPVLLIMKREASDWRISSLRVAVPRPRVGRPRLL
jgi:hypothetical protein